MATHSQLIQAGLAEGAEPPGPPWHPVQGTPDASTAVYAVMRKRVRGREREAWIGTVCIRYGARKASLEADGWEEVAPQDIGIP